MFSRQSQAVRYLEALPSATRIRNWGDETIESAADELSAPVHGEQLLRRLIWAASGRQTGSPLKVVHKGDPVMPWTLDRVLRQDSAASGIVMIRDPRGVYASHCRALTTHSSLDFSMSPHQLADEWIRTASVAMNPPARCLVIRYEDLFHDAPGILEEIGQLLSLQDLHGDCATGQSVSPDYAASIPSSDRVLHSRVAQPPDPSRAEVWRKELDDQSIALIQDLIPREMLDHFGYELAPVGASTGLQRLRSDVKYRVVTPLRRKLRGARRAVRSPSLLQAKVRTRIGRSAPDGRTRE